MKRQKSHDDSKIHEEYLDEETEQLMKRTDTLNTNTSTKNLFQFFFEKALGPKAAPPKIKQAQEVKESKGFGTKSKLQSSRGDDGTSVKWSEQ